MAFLLVACLAFALIGACLRPLAANFEWAKGAVGCFFLLYMAGAVCLAVFVLMYEGGWHWLSSLAALGLACAPICLFDIGYKGGEAEDGPP